MERQGTLASLILLMAACGGPQKAAPAREPEVAYTLDVADLRPVEGDLASVAFRIRNGTDRYVVLRDLTMAGDTGTVVTWQFSMPGYLEYAAGRDEWIYDRRKAGRRLHVFNSGLLAPTESILVRARIRLLALPREFHLSWLDLTLDDVKKKVYFESRQDRETRYRCAYGRELEQLLLPDPRKDLSGIRSVIFPHAEQVVPSSRAVRILVETPLQPRPFALAQAAQRAGVPPPATGDHTWSSALDGWVIRTGNEWRLVTSAAITPLPRLRSMERTFHYLDALGVGRIEVEFLRETKSVFAEKRRLVSDPQGRRFYLFLTRAELLPFLKDVRGEGFDLDVDVSPEGGGRLLVTR